MTKERLRYTHETETYVLRLGIQETKWISRGCSLRGRYCNTWIDFPEKCCTSLAWNQCTSSMSRYDRNIKRGNKKAMEKLTENVKIMCLQTPIWKVSCHRSIISGLLGSFNGKWQGFSMVCSESEASRYCLHFLVKQNLFERSNWVNLHGAARLRNNFCQEKNYIRSKLTLVLARIEFWKNST